MGDGQGAQEEEGFRAPASYAHSATIAGPHGHSKCINTEVVRCIDS